MTLFALYCTLCGLSYHGTLRFCEAMNLRIYPLLLIQMCFLLRRINAHVVLCIFAETYPKMCTIAPLSKPKLAVNTREIKGICCCIWLDGSSHKATSGVICSVNNVFNFSSSPAVANQMACDRTEAGRLPRTDDVLTSFVLLGCCRARISICG